MDLELLCWRIGKLEYHCYRITDTEPSTLMLYRLEERTSSSYTFKS